MANEEVLRLRTTVVSDEALAQIRALGREIGLMPARAKPHVQSLNNDFAGLSNTIKKMGSELLSAVPALGAFGFGAASAGAAMGVLINTMNNAAKRVVELKYASKELGMSERDIRAWGVTAEKAGVSAQSMMSGMEAFKKTTDGLKYNIGGARDELYSMGAGPIVQRMQAATTQAEKMKVAFQFKDELMKDDPSGFKARMFFDQIGLGADKARLSYESWQRAQARIKPLTKEDEDRAQAYADALVDLGEAWDHFTIKAGAGLFPKLTQDMKDLESLLGMLGKLDAWVDSWLGKSNNPNADVMGRLVSKMLGKSDPADAAAPGAAAPGPSFNDRFPGAGEFGAPNALRQNRGSLMRRGSSLYHPSAFTDGFQPASFGGSGGGLNEGSRMVKDGVFAALVDFQSYIQTGGGAGTGMMNASFGGSGGAAAGGGAGGGAASFGGGGYTNLTPGTGGGTAGTTPSGSSASPQAFEPGTGRVSGDTGGAGVRGGNAGGSGGIAAPAGTPIARTGLATVTAASGRKFQVDQRFAQNFQGFINDYEKAGGQLGPDTGTLGSRPHNASGHPIGAAIDINQIGRGVRSRAGRGTSLDPKVEDELAKKWGMVSGNQWRSNDQGHFGIKSVEEARQALIRNGVEPGQASKIASAQVGGPSEGGKTVKGSWFGNAPGWNDPSEPKGSPKSNRPGIALRDKSTMGQMFEVTTPDGRKFMLPQTDWGPAARTGRGIDITAAAGAQMGYTSKNFPTDQPFTYRRVDEAINNNATGGAKAEGSVNVSIESNGTAARAKATTDGGLWQKSTIENYKQMQPTSDPVGQVATK